MGFDSLNELCYFEAMFFIARRRFYPEVSIYLQFFLNYCKEQQKQCMKIMVILNSDLQMNRCRY